MGCIIWSIANTMNKNTTATHKKQVNPFLLVLLSFIFIIIIGSGLLYLDLVINAPEGFNPSIEDYVDCFFVSVSASCVTGLNPFAGGIIGTFSIFGQIVLACLIQIGGLGFITILAFLITLFAGKISFKDRYWLSQAVGSTSFAHVIKFVRQIILISIVCELIGFGLFIPGMINLFPNDISHALWVSAFHSISSFNNAGFDLLGNTSLIVADGSLLASAPGWVPVYNQIVTMVLVVMGGLSFLTIIEIFSFKKRPSQYRAFVKIVLFSTAGLLLGGSLLFMIFECFKSTNPMTPLDAIFQSVTCRTAGFATYDQGQLTTGSQIVSCLLMFIGGAPLGTAGGIKITTFFIVILSMYSYIRGREVSAFHRKYSQKQIIRAMSLIFFSLFVIIFSFGAIKIIEGGKFTTESICFEAFSAFGTVGLSANLTTELSIGSKLILCLLMYIGRLGPMTMFSVFSKNINIESKLHYELVEEDLLIG